MLIDPRRLRFEPHPVFETPPDDATLSRYMTLPKYLSLLTGRYLFFCRVDGLGDRFEGSFPTGHFEEVRRDMEAALKDSPVLAIKGVSREDLAKSMLRDQRGFHAATRACAAASCWHEGETESAALWSMYSGADSGICLRSTTARLKRALTGVAGGETELPYFLGRLRYVDYRTARMPRENVLWPLTFKRKSFEHEREVRALIVDYSRLSNALPEDLESVAIPAGGLAVIVQVEDLVSEVLVSPSAPAWYAEAVLSATERLGLRFPVRVSEMAEAPEF